MRESAVSAKRVGVSLARNRRSPKRPSEPAAKRASTRKRAQWGKDAKLTAGSGRWIFDEELGRLPAWKHLLLNKKR